MESKTAILLRLFKEDKITVEEFELLNQKEAICTCNGCTRNNSQQPYNPYYPTIIYSTNTAGSLYNTGKINK